MGSIGILNVGAGDTKLVFDKSDPAECIRAARIVTDMLRRGYALLVEVKKPGGKSVYQRAYAFREDTCEYVIADLDPVAAEKADREEESHETHVGQAAGARAAPGDETPPKRRRGRTRAVSATGTRAVAVARSAGG